MDQLSTKLGPLRALPASRERHPMVLSVCCHTLVFICHAYDKLMQVKNKASSPSHKNILVIDVNAPLFTTSQTFNSCSC